MSIRIFNPWEKPEYSERVEVVFENRFRQYGAYKIRKLYERNKVIAMFLSALFVLEIMLAMQWPAEKPVQKNNIIFIQPPDTLKVTPVFENDIASSGSRQSDYPNSHGSDGGGSDLIPTFDLKAPVLSGFKRGNGFGQGDGGDDFLPGKNGIPRGDGEDGREEGKKKSEKMNRACSFPGGENRFTEYIQDHFIPPAACVDASSSAWVEVQFRINENGVLTDVVILGASSSCPEFTAESKRVVQSSPKWISAVVNGKAVSALRKMQIQLVY